MFHAAAPWGLLMAFFLCLSIRAQAQEQPSGSAQPQEKAFWQSISETATEYWSGTVGSTSDMLSNGEALLLVPALTYHMPFAYNREQLDDQNNNPLPGLGFGRGKLTPSGNWQGIYAMGFRDSWDKPSWLLAYNYNWLHHSEGLYWGVGSSAGLMSRNDYFGYAPFPYILPTFSVGTRHISLEASYVPGFVRGTGNVLFLWFRIK